MSPKMKATIICALAITLALFSLCVSNKEAPEENTGGDCSYKAINGRCTILSFQGDSPLAPVSVKYTFTPTDDVDAVLGEENDLKDTLKNTGRTYTESSKDLGMSCLEGVSTPKKEDLETKCGLKEYKVVPCSVEVIESGTCAPLIFSFSGL